MTTCWSAAEDPSWIYIRCLTHVKHYCDGRGYDELKRGKAMTSIIYLRAL